MEKHRNRLGRVSPATSRFAADSRRLAERAAKLAAAALAVAAGAAAAAAAATCTGAQAADSCLRSRPTALTSHTNGC
eukprot:353781-Chlamydomonas_euryale.AAC.3